VVEGAGHGRGPARGVMPGALTALLAEVAAAPEKRETEAAPLAPGTRVGRFEILRELGRGGFGVVYEARDRDLGRQVALKVVRPGRVAGEVGKVTHEAEAVARLAHPNLVTLHDLGTSEHGPFLVFELLRGKTLDLRTEEGPLTVQEAVHVATEVARGLSHAHAEGVVHRDLKPSNVFITSNGQVKILDFGMAHAFGRRRLSGGTPAYMAPEQWEDDPEDERTDVFALGVMLHRMLTGEYPFPEGKGKWSSEAGRVPKLDVPGAPGLADLVERMLDRSPKGRPRDGAAVLADLASVEDALRAKPADGSPPVHARRRKATIGDLLAELKRRHVFPVMVVYGILAIAAAGGGAWYAWRRVGEGGATPTAGVGPSIAVLAFADLSPAKDQEYLSDGVAEEILNALSRVEGLKVIGRTSSFFFKGKNVELAEIGRRLGVGTILEGSVRTDGKRIRVGAQLVRAADGARLWSETYEREAGAAFAIQDDVARDVARSLRLKLLPAGKAYIPSTPEAHTAYLLALHLANASGSNEGQVAVQAAWAKVAELDPGFAPALAALAVLEVWNAPYPLPDVNRKKAWELASEAIALAPQGAEGYSSRAWLRVNNDLDWAGGEADIAEAVRRNPSAAEPVFLQAGIHAALRGGGLASKSFRRALELNPLKALWWKYLSDFLLGEGDISGARDAARRSLEISPAGIAAQNLVLADLLEGKGGTALEAAARQAKAEDRLLLTAMAEHTLGHPAESRKAIAELTSEFGESSPFRVAQAHAWAGHVDEAFAWLDRTHAGGFIEGTDVGMVRHNPALRGLESDPRWKTFLRRFKVPVD
jgi:TolB-like protein